MKNDLINDKNIVLEVYIKIITNLIDGGFHSQAVLTLKRLVKILNEIEEKEK